MIPESSLPGCDACAAAVDGYGASIYTTCRGCMVRWLRRMRPGQRAAWLKAAGEQHSEECVAAFAAEVAQQVST